MLKRKRIVKNATELLLDTLFPGFRNFQVQLAAYKVIARTDVLFHRHCFHVFNLLSPACPRFYRAYVLCTNRTLRVRETDAYEVINSRISSPTTQITWSP